MEQNEMRQELPQNTIWEKLAGRRLVLSGIDGPEYQMFFQSLVSISTQTGIGFRVVDGVENILDDDLVILFARPGEGRTVSDAEADRAEAQERARREKRWDTPFDDPEKHYSWKKPAGSWKAAGADWADERKLLMQLRETASVKAQAVVLVSGNEVYGTCFGKPHLLKEEELGYLSHTDSTDAAAQCMRTAEHFACMLYREEQLPIRIVRIGSISDEEELQPTLLSCIKVLLYGENGEIYNLPDKNTEEKTEKEVLREPDYIDSADEGNRAGAEAGKSEIPYEEAANERRPEIRDEKTVNERQPETPYEETANERQPEDTDAPGGFAEPGKSSEIESDVVQRIRERKMADRKIIQFPVGNAAGKELKFRQDSAAAEQTGDSVHTKTVYEQDKPPAEAYYTQRSPLAPLEIITDTEKAEKLGK